MAAAAQSKSESKIKVNVSRVIQEAMHFPSESGFPLYPHMDAANNGDRPPAWIARMNASFSSPCNIRGVYISATSVEVRFWQKPIVNGKPLGGLTRKAAIQQEESMVDLTGEKFTLLGKRISFLREPHVLSNLEELWIHPEVAKGLIPDNMYGWFKQAMGKVMGDNGNALTNAIYASFNLDPARFTEMFPLLRGIVVYTGKPYSIPAERRDAMEAEKGKRVTSCEDVEGLKQHAAATGSAYVVSLLPNVNIKKFTVRDYTFDDKFLRSYRERLLERYASVRVGGKAAAPEAQSVQESQAVEVQNEEMSPLEAQIESRLEKGSSIQTIALVLAAMFEESGGVAALNKEYDVMTDEGKQRFEKLFQNVRAQLGKLKK